MDSLKIFILSVWILVLFGCHNNAHIRTQKILEKKESVISVSGVLPIGGIDDRYSIDDENGILVMRGELSYIKGFGNYELGPYAGFGLSDFDDPGFILGFDYKNYFLGVQRFQTDGISQMTHNDEKDGYKNNTFTANYGTILSDGWNLNSNLTHRSYFYFLLADKKQN